jgi:maleate isomerase
MEPEFYRTLTPYISVHSSRLRLREVTVSGLEAMERETERAAQELSDAGVNLLCYGCTSGSLFKGIGHDRVLIQRIEKQTGIPAIATAGAVIDALRALRSKKIAVATPYTKEIDDLETKFLDANGLEVMKIVGLGLARNLDIGLQKPSIAYDLAKKANVAGADAVFISCTNFRTIDIIEKLEKELGKPVVSSNTATAWMILRTLRIKDRVQGYGQLLALT